jgi:hypothetical protein
MVAMTSQASTSPQHALAHAHLTRRPTKITFGEMRSDGGPTRVLIYCADYRCSHSMAMSADQWPDDLRLSDIEPRFICQACGKRGADVRPHFSPPRMGSRR